MLQSSQPSASPSYDIHSSLTTLVILHFAFTGLLPFWVEKKSLIDRMLGVIKKQQRGSPLGHESAVQGFLQSHVKVCLLQGMQSYYKKKKERFSRS